MYPFGDIDREQHRRLAQKMYDIELAKEANGGRSSSPADEERSVAEEAVFAAVSFLIDKFSMECSIFEFAGELIDELKSLCSYLFLSTIYDCDVVFFADVFSCHGGKSILAASSFGFKAYTSLDVDRESKQGTTRFANTVPALIGKTTIVEGSLQDYFPSSCDIVFADATCECE
jgi:hypothetical protein